jgi:hypothetical protein
LREVQGVVGKIGKLTLDEFHRYIAGRLGAPNRRVLVPPQEDSLFLNGVYRMRYPAALRMLPAGEPSKHDAERALQVAWAVRDWLGEQM